MTDYKQKANELRKTVLKMTHHAQSSHIGSNLGSADLMTVIYDIADLSLLEDGRTKDIVIVKSWNAANAYACLVAKGLLPQEAVDKYGDEDTKWTTILEPIQPYIPAGTGAMGYHLPFAVGFALAKKIKGEEGKVYCLISDAEMQIGATWESAQIAAQHKLDNLVLVVDWNGLQAMGRVDEILNVEPLAEKWEAFNWRVSRINGHDYTDIERTLRGESYIPKEQQHLPHVIIARTTKGKGVSFMEDVVIWHYQHVNAETLEKALAELQ